MSTDATAAIQVADERGSFEHADDAHRVHLRRDYLFFDLVAGGRSSDPRDAVVPIRPPPPDGATVYDCYSTFLDADELAVVGAAYRERIGRASEDIDMLIAEMRSLATETRREVRVLIAFF